MTFRTRILLTFLLLFTTSFTLVIAYLYHSTSAAIQQETITHLQRDAAWALQDLSEQVESLQLELAAMATARVWYDNSSREYLLARLKSYQNIYSLFENIVLYDSSGKVVTSSSRRGDADTGRCRCWQEGIAGGKGFHVIAGESGEQSVIHFYQGVRNSRGGYPAVLSGRASISPLIKHLRGADKNSHGEKIPYLIELITADGKIFFALPDTGLVGREVADRGRLKGEIAGLKSQGQGSSSWSTSTSLHILAVSTQNSAATPLPWIMHIHVSKELLFATIRSQRQKLSLLAALMLGVSGLSIWIASARLSRPVKELTALVSEAGMGKFDAVKAFPARSDEFSSLVESMRMMGSRLEAALAELKEREAAARQNEKMFRTVADYTIAWEFWFSPQGTFFYISPSCQQVTGYTPAEFQEEPALLSLIVHPEDRCCYEEHLANVLDVSSARENPHEELQFRIVTKQGDVRWIGHVCRPVIDDNGRFLGRRGSNRDITEQKQFEALIRKLNEELEEKVHSRTKELESTVRELESFCYAISHEIRAPLARMEGFSRLAGEEIAQGSNEQLQFYTERLTAASLQLREVIDGLLFITRLPRMEIRRQQINLSGLAAGFAAQEPLRGVKFDIAAAVSASADPLLGETCLRVLLDNAVKFSAAQPSPRIEFGVVAGAAGENVYYVRDNGVGFDMRYVDKLFIPFSKLHPQKEFAGTGLGLATARRIIERHGGRIWAEAAPQAGAVFYFTFDRSEEIT